MLTNLVQSAKVRQPTGRRILLANAKGGCGKTTIATNLASYYARAGYSCALIDCDPQGSSSQWLRSREDTLPDITGVEAYKAGPGATRNYQMRLPREISRVIIDTPAALAGGELDDQIRQTDLIVVPVLPSSIDIHAATRFISRILLSVEYRRRPKPLLVIANRVRQRTVAMTKLDTFLRSLKLPHIGTLRDTQLYVQCAEQGRGIVDTSGKRFAADTQRWHEIHDTIEHYLQHEGPPYRQSGTY